MDHFHPPGLCLQLVIVATLAVTGAEAVWANKKFHGHCTLPSELVAEAEKKLII